MLTIVVCQLQKQLDNNMDLAQREIKQFQMHDDWEKWQRSLDIYFLANSITDDQIKRAKLLHYGGTELQDLFYILPGANVEKSPDNNVYNIAVEKFKEYFLPKRSTAYERHIFFGLCQNTGELVEQFAYRLRKQASKCNFTHDIDEYIRDQITSKTNNEKLQVFILKHDELSLNEVLNHAKALEAISSHKQAFQKPNQDIFKIEASKTTVKPECYRCGKKTHFGTDLNCPARKQRCSKCNLLGHYATKCRTRNLKRQYSGPSREYSARKQQKFANQKLETIRAIKEEDNDF